MCASKSEELVNMDCGVWSYYVFIGVCGIPFKISTHINILWETVCVQDILDYVVLCIIYLD